MPLADTLVPEEAKNVGGVDRKLRATVGVLLLTVAVVLVASQRAVYGAVVLAAAAGLLFNAATGFCAMNALFGIDTCSRE